MYIHAFENFQTASDCSEFISISGLYHRKLVHPVVNLQLNDDEFLYNFS